MRFRIPPLVPPYAVLLLVITYAVGSLWLGLARLDAITHLAEATAQNAATANDLDTLLAAVNDIESAGRGFALTADDSYLEEYERGRRRIPGLLSSLRDRMRDDPTELALIEQLVTLIAERSTITAAVIDQKRRAPEKPLERMFGNRGKLSSEEIRTVVATLGTREQDELEQVRRTLAGTLDQARMDLYLMACVTLLLVISLFLAVRRLKSFFAVLPEPGPGTTIEIAPDAAVWAGDAGVGTLLRDALLRVRQAAASESTESSLGEHLQSLIAAMERALAAHTGAYDGDLTQPQAKTVVHAMALLGQAYTTPERLTVKATIDQTVKVPDVQKAFLILRSTEWALEAITLRKRTGDVTLSLTGVGDRVRLRILALTDNPEFHVTLTPRETEEANALRQGVTAIGGTFILDESPTGFSLAVTVSADS
jgi:CHASE3 domain sensor protein